MKRFPNCQFGPMQVRAVLRAGREPGERLVGWSTGQLQHSGPVAILMHGLMHIPGLQIMGLLLLAKQSRFFVLTDRRLVILPVERPSLKQAGKWVVMPVGEVAMSGGTKSMFASGLVFRAEHDRHVRTMRIQARKKSRAGHRLVQGLRLLVSEG